MIRFSTSLSPQKFLQDHHRLGVVALLESLRARLHDPALRIREVALRLPVRLAVAPLVRLPPPRRSTRARLPPPVVIGPPLRRFQTLLRLPDRQQTPLPTPQLLRQFVPPIPLPVAAILLLILLRRRRQQPLDLLPQARLLLQHPVVAHRLPLARARAHLRPVDRECPEANQPHLPRNPNHLQKQRPEVRQMTMPELADRPMLGKVPRRQHPKRHVLFQLPRYPPRRENPRRIPVDQHLHHHRWRIRRVPTTVPLIGSVKRRKIQRIHHIAHLVRQVPLRNPLPHLRRHQQNLIRLICTKSRRHPQPPTRTRTHLLQLDNPSTLSDARTSCGADS